MPGSAYSIRMKNLLLFLAILCTFLFPAMLIYRSRVKSRPGIIEKIRQNSCEALLRKLNPSISVMLIDVDFLNVLGEESCTWNEGKHIKIGVDIKYLSNRYNIDESKFDVIYYFNNASKDFYDFEVNGSRRLIPRRFETIWIDNFQIPKNVQKFSEFWKRSNFLDCVGFDMARNKAAEIVLEGPPSANILARLRDKLLDNGMFPFLNGGTFLGWYRECTVIPHTTDMDMAVFQDNFNPEYIDQLLKDNSEFKLIRKLGSLEDSLELTVIPKLEKGPNIDVFIMYDGIEDGVLKYHYVSGLSGDGTKYRYTYPIYDPWCAAELHDHIFWVSCSAKTIIPLEYGPQWYRDHLSDDYKWKESGKNVKPVGKFTKDEMQKYYLTYG